MVIYHIKSLWEVWKEDPDMGISAIDGLMDSLYRINKGMGYLLCKFLGVNILVYLVQKSPIGETL